MLARDKGARGVATLARCVRRGGPRPAMSLRLNIPRVRKSLLIQRVAEQAASNPALLAVASLGNLSSADKFKVRYGLEEAGATVNFTKNTLTRKGLEQYAPEALDLAPLLRGRTMLACGPAEVPLAKQLLALEKTLPNFAVLGALLHSTRILQVAELERLSKLPPVEQVHTQMVSQMMPGAVLQVPNVAAYLVSVLQHRVDALKEGGSSE